MPIIVGTALLLIAGHVIWQYRQLAGGDTIYEGPPVYVLLRPIGPSMKAAVIGSTNEKRPICIRFGFGKHGSFPSFHLRLSHFAAVELIGLFDQALLEQSRTSAKAKVGDFTQRLGVVHQRISVIINGRRGEITIRLRGIAPFAAEVRWIPMSTGGCKAIREQLEHAVALGSPRDRAL